MSTSTGPIEQHSGSSNQAQPSIMSGNYSLWVGIDWATEEHQVCVMDHERQVIVERSVRHTGEAIAKFADELIARANGDAAKIAVAIETPRGAIIETLMDRGAAVFSINPKQLDRYRDRYTVAGAKDDRRDAFVLADTLRTDAPAYRRVHLRSPELVLLRELVRIHEQVSQELNALGNRFREQLHRFFPQVLTLGSVYRDRWLWDLVEAVPTPNQAQRLRPRKVQAILKQHRIRRLKATEVIDALRSTPLRVAPGVAEASAQHIAMLLPRIRLSYAQCRQCGKQIDVLLDQLAQPQGVDEQPNVAHRDAAILRSMPGVGTIVAAIILSEAALLLEQRDYRNLRTQCGVAPVTRQTGIQGKKKGKKPTVLMRRACNPRLRKAVYHWARTSVQYDQRSKEHYAKLRAKGHRHGRALRGVADRLLDVLIAMLKARQLYDPTRRIRSAVSNQASEPADGRAQQRGKCVSD